jgi:hypothetical protein
MPTPKQYPSPAARQAAYRQRQAEARRQELQRRGLPPLPGVSTIPGYARWEALSAQALLLLRTIQEEMEQYYEARSCAWQETERGETFLERIETLQEATAAVEALHH